MPDYIESFMWGFQSHFRTQVELAVEAAMLELGRPAEIEVFLIGLLRDGGTGHPLCIEPEDGPLAPTDFADMGHRAEELLQANPDRRIRYSDPRLQDLRERAMHRAASRDAIAATLADKLGGRFTVAMPTLVNEHDVYTAIGLPQDLIDSFPALTTETADDGRIVLMRSLLEGALDKLRREISRALYEPDPGSDLGRIVGAGVVARDAGEALAIGVAYRADSSRPAHGFFDAMSQLATTRYEKRAGLGKLIVASPSSPSVDRVLLLDQVVPMNETRTIRKLLETSSGDGAALLTNGSVAYGLGVINSSYDVGSESVFEIVVSGPGAWDIRHATTPLMTVTYGAPHLPAERLSRSRFDETARRVLAPVGPCDADRLWELAMAAAEAEHGTRLVVSAEASAEASRLQGQALLVQPAQLSADQIRQVTSIDGAVLVDPMGALAAIGLILDGVATGDGDRARGARFNSAVRYLASAPKGTMVVLVSEDGMLDLMPRLRPQMQRTKLASLLDDLRSAAALEPVHGERFYKAYTRVKAAAFYLDRQQCAEVNALCDNHWNRRRAAGAQLWTIEPPLVPDATMSDEYLVD